MSMQELTHAWLIICPMVFLAGLMDSVAGGGGLISLPAYLLAGLPATMALGTNKCGSVFGALVSASRFAKHKQYHLGAAVSAGLAALVGSTLGSHLSRFLSDRFLYYLILTAIPVLAWFILFKPNFGETDRTDRWSQRGLLAVSAGIGFVLGGYDGFFGPGSGTFMMLAFTTLGGFDLLTASGNTKIANAASNVAATITFALAGQVNWAIGLPAAVCSMAGHYLGSSLAFKNGAKVIRPTFLVAMVLLVAKLVTELLG